MSRIGKMPIPLPAGVSVKVADNNVVTVKGPKGQITRSFNPSLKIKEVDGKIIVERPSNSKNHKALHGLTRALLNNMVKGVSEGFKKEQELIGVGYRAEAKGQILELTLGYSHTVQFEIPPEVKVETKTEKGKPPLITLTSIDKELLGLVAAKIRSFRKPEPYKGKGIKFVDEVIRRKAGKQAGKGK
ncbi:MAG: 50S ribosomal protein L6 [Flavobacteriales bacterium]|nr:50S ribosomal protein L6 [Flavobacteriales bacterium]MCX7768030.1 50S ribosomal protein L6 [Flavobacteriales bacterium]MDW8409235.1 50S ribosomal protein L6 [Flavobacteriales bacterium]